MAKKSVSNRKIGARKPDDYDNESEGRREGNAPPDDFTLNPKMKATLMRPRYKEGPMRYRPFPMLDYADPKNKLMPGRKSVNKLGQSPWTIRMYAAKYIGLADGPHFTFNLYRPKQRKEMRKQNPYHVFFDACYQAHDKGEFVGGGDWDAKWNKLMKGSKKSGAQIAPPKELWYSQGAVYQNGEKFYVGEEAERELPLGLAPDDDLVVIQTPGTAGTGLMELADEQLEEYEGDPETDPACAFKYGDLLGKFLPKKRIIVGGYIITIFHPKITKKITEDTSWNGEIADMQGYEAALKRKFKYDGKLYLPDIDSAGVDQIFDKVQFWLDDAESKSEGLLRIAPMEQQALWVAQAYAKIPKLLKFAWAEHEEFFTDEVKAILTNRASVAMPGKDDDEEEDATVSKKTKKKDVTESKKKKGRQDDDEDEEDDTDTDTDADDDDGDDDEDEKPKRRKSKTKVDDDEEEDDDEDGDDDDSDSDDEDDDEDDDDDSDSDDDDGDDDSDDDSEDDDEDEDEDEKPKKKGKGKKSKSEDDEDDDSEDDDEEDDDSEDDDADDDEGDDDEEDGDDDEDADDDSDSEDDDEDEDEDEKPKKKGKGKGKKGEDEFASDPKGKKKKGGKDYEFPDAPAGKKDLKKSKQAADKAKGNSKKRGSAPKEAPPKPKTKKKKK